MITRLSIAAFASLALAGTLQLAAKDPTTAPATRPTIVVEPYEPLFGDTTQPTTAPTTRGISMRPATRPMVRAKPATAPTAKVSDEAAKVLADVRTAYGSLKSLELAGTVTGDFDIAGDRSNPVEKLASAFQAPDKFQIDLENTIVLGSTGAKAYLLNKTDGRYITAAAPKGRTPSAELPFPMPQLLCMANQAASPSVDPSLMLAMSKDSTQELSRYATQIDKVADVDLDGKAITALELTLPAEAGKVTLLIDPQTHLVRQSITDLSAGLLKAGAKNVKSAKVTVAYSKTAADVELKEDRFNWEAPKDAHEATGGGASASADQADDAPAGPATALEGKPAPAFTLPALDGKEFSLAEAKGDVVIIDFWATWCGPCKASLPHLDALSQEKELSAQGLRVYAVDLREDKEKVQGFVTGKGFKFNVLLDADGKVAQKYGVEGIPQTVIIGRDGSVKKVIIGFAPGGETALREAALAALKEAKP